jgi:hypothetical protein
VSESQQQQQHDDSSPAARSDSTSAAGGGPLFLVARMLAARAEPLLGLPDGSRWPSKLSAFGAPDIDGCVPGSAYVRPYDVSARRDGASIESTSLLAPKREVGIDFGGFTLEFSAPRGAE